MFDPLNMKKTSGVQKQHLIIDGVESDTSVITEQPYNEGLIHRKYKQARSYM